jgi:Ankyrin repeats (many copies)
MASQQSSFAGRRRMAAQHGAAEWRRRMASQKLGNAAKGTDVRTIGSATTDATQAQEHSRKMAKSACRAQLDSVYGLAKLLADRYKQTHAGKALDTVECEVVVGRAVGLRGFDAEGKQWEKYGESAGNEPYDGDMCIYLHEADAFETYDDDANMISNDLLLQDMLSAVDHPLKGRISSVAPDGTRKLHRAACAGSVDRVRSALRMREQGGDVDERFSFDDKTALHFAALFGHADVAALLLDAGADVGAKTTRGETPLHFAANAATAALLLKAGADVGARTVDGETALHFATTRVRSDVVELLLQRRK